MTDPLVSGKIIFEPVTPHLAGATIHIRLEDVSIADKASETISEQTLSDVTDDMIEQDGIPFELYGQLPDDKARYIVSVHVDSNDNGEVSQGDFITTESYPVLTFGNPDSLTVRVQRIEQ
ncbi:YbaY family lipoprotein [Haladaptatus sp. NG-SE-30]